VDKDKILREIAEEVAVCKNCSLHYSRKNGVPGEGPADTEIMLIGEGPGFYENEQGRPFVGASGKFLTELLLSGGVDRNKVFITNVVKCRPPGNRDPQDEELAACSKYLDRQIEVINPRIIITLGRFSMSRYMPQAKISRIHGQAVWVKGRLIVPMYHPAAALHQPSLKTVVMQDFARIPEWIKKSKQASPSVEENHPRDEDEKPDGEGPVQLSLF
jgi:uracil-DNA glycosylase family 4